MAKIPLQKKSLYLAWVTALALAVTACAPGGKSPDGANPENVLFESNIGAEFTGYTVSFQYPRSLEVGYFSDSGVFGWTIADANPQEVFWRANQAGDEISILLMLWQENDEFAGQSPVQLLEQQFSTTEKITEFTEGEKQVAYYYQSGEVRAAIVSPNVFLMLFGSFPTEKEEQARNCVETILHSVKFHDAAGKDYSSATIWGIRNEGPLAKSNEQRGYLPLASASAWEIQTSGNELTLTIASLDQDAELMVDILDKDGKSTLTEGGIQFTGKLEGQKISLPADGTYTIQILPQSDWYGWYTIQIQ